MYKCLIVVICNVFLSPCLFSKQVHMAHRVIWFKENIALKLFLVLVLDNSPAPSGRSIQRVHLSTHIVLLPSYLNFNDFKYPHISISGAENWLNFKDYVTK